jgi:hypothetical protein
LSICSSSVFIRLSAYLCPFVHLSLRVFSSFTFYSMIHFLKSLNFCTRLISHNVLHAFFFFFFFLNHVLFLYPIPPRPLVKILRNKPS